MAMPFQRCFWVYPQSTYILRAVWWKRLLQYISKVCCCKVEVWGQMTSKKFGWQVVWPHFSLLQFYNFNEKYLKNTADYLIQNVVEYYRELAYVLVENAVFRLIRFKGKTSLMFAKLNSVCNTFSHWVCLSCNKRENTSIFPHKKESNSFQLLPHLMQCLYDSYNLKTVFPPLL